MLVTRETEVSYIISQLSLLNLLLASEISLTNTASADLTWNLSSVAPAYVKVCNALMFLFIKPIMKIILNFQPGNRKA